MKEIFFPSFGECKFIQDITLVRAKEEISFRFLANRNAQGGLYYYQHTTSQLQSPSPFCHFICYRSKLYVQSCAHACTCVFVCVVRCFCVYSLDEKQISSRLIQEKNIELLFQLSMRMYSTIKKFFIRLKQNKWNNRIDLHFKETN